MRTEELVDLLAAGGGTVDGKPLWLRFGVAAGAGVIVAAVLMLALLGVRADLRFALAQPMFWLKVVFAALVALAGLAAASRLSRPGMKLAGSSAALAAPVLAVWALAAFALIDAEPGSRAALILGRTWTTCPYLIAVLSVPAFTAIVWAMKGFAPTRMRLAGAIAGFAAGALGTLVYTLHCPESSAAFVAIWYVAGMLVPTLIGALIGPRVLRW